MTGPAIRGARQLTSWTFQVLNESGRWVVLDERRNPYAAFRNYAICSFYLDTDEYFTHFRLVPENGAEFSLHAFELHGFLDPVESHLFVSESTDGIDGMDEIDDPFDPWNLPDFD
jgi:hypothetical protein